MNTSRHISIVAVGVAFTIGSSVVPTVGADVETAVYGTPNSFSFEYKIKHMPDLDQRRQFLPGQGAMYCVPTSIMNLFAYGANHGFPNLPPGSGYWQSDALYNTATSHIDTLGQLMGTDPVMGTTGGIAGPYFWLVSNQIPLTVEEYIFTDYWFPRIENLVKSAVLLDGIVSFAYGRYPYGIEDNNVVVIGARDGGHMVTLSEAERTIPFRASIGVRDPADEPQEGLYLFTQSQFTTRMFPDAHDLVIRNAGSLAGRFGTVLEFPPGGSRIAIIDSYLRIRPKMGYGWESSEITFNFPSGFLGSSNQHPALAAVGHTLIDAVLTPEADSTIVLAEVGGDTPHTLFEVDLLTGERVEIAPVPDAVGLVFGRKRELYVIQQDQILCFNIDAGETTPSASAPLPGLGAAVEYNDTTDLILALLPEEHMILSYREGLPAGAPPTMMPIPEDIPMGGGGSLAVNPADGGIWFITDASDEVYMLMPGPGGPMVEVVSMPQIVSPMSLSFDDAGDMFVMSEKGLTQLRRNPLNNEWMMAEEPFFGDGVGPMEGFRVTRSRTNFDPAIHTAPGYLNFEPSENEELFDDNFAVPDCNADLNGDGVVNGADLAVLLSSWGPCDICLVDLNSDRIIDGADLAILLASWGDCG